MKLTVKVRPREEDSTHVCTLCPVAQALREAVGLQRAQAPCVGKGVYTNLSRQQAFAQPERIYARGQKWMIAQATPKHVADWLKNWDKTGGKGEAFDFEVEALDCATVPRPHGEWIQPGCGAFDQGNVNYYVPGGVNS